MSIAWARKLWQNVAQVPEVQQGGLRPEFTARAVIIGLAIGCLLCFTNLYFGLQTGWISMMSLQSALLGYLISLLLPNPISPQENVVLQTVATATGTMPLAAGFVGILPALTLLDPEKDGSPPIEITWWSAVLWSCAIAFFGVFLSPPIRKQVIIQEQLAFPSGTATAQLISVLHDISPPSKNGPAIDRRRGYSALQGEDDVTIDDSARDHDTQATEEELEREEERGIARRDGWSALGWSFAVSASMTLMAYFFPVIFAVPLFGHYLAREWLWSFTPSLSYVGQGIIMGFPTALSMNLGMIVGWAVLSPLSKLQGWAPGPVGDMSSGARGWILWTSLAIMVSDSVVSLLPIVREFVQKSIPANIVIWRKSKPRSRSRSPSRLGPDSAQLRCEDENDFEPPERLVPREWVLWGLGLSIVVGTVLVWIVFGAEGIRPWATIIGFLMGGLLSLLGVRALGETDLNPVSGLGKISQLLFAFIQPGNVVANIIAGGVAEAGAQQAGDLMQDLKTGHLLRASPRAQFFGQLIGSTFSIVVTATAYNLYTRAYPIPGPSFPAPTAYVWLSLARLLRNGQLPPHSQSFMLSFAILFSLTSFIKTRASQQQSPYARWIPSGVAFAIGFLNAPSFSIARLIGGVIELVYHARLRNRNHHSHGSDIKLIVIASGFVLGEGVISVVSLILRTFDVGVASCWGCVPGMCAGCAS